MKRDKWGRPIREREAGEDISRTIPMELMKKYPSISPYMKKQYEKILFPQFSIPQDMQRDPMVIKWLRRFREVRQHLLDTGVDKTTIMKEVKKLRREFIKDLIKKYPKKKSKLERAMKEQERDFERRMKLKELLDIGSRRMYTNKEEQELKRISLKYKQLAER